MAIRKIKISELPVVQSLIGLYTIGVDALNRSVRVSLQFVTDAATNANEKATAANAAASNANGKATLANNAATAANTATDAANTAATNANTKAELANTKAALANEAAENANDAATNANEAADKANAAQGPKGDPGEKGDTGDTGPKGDTGEQGPKGDTGTADKSAYQSAVDGGYAGTEADFNQILAKMKLPIHASEILSVAGWTGNSTAGYTYTVSNSDITDGCTIFIVPVQASEDIDSEAGIYEDNTAAVGSFTLNARNLPTGERTIKYVIFP
jgi:hypothetical protein